MFVFRVHGEASLQRLLQTFHAPVPHLAEYRLDVRGAAFPSKIFGMLLALDQLLRWVKREKVVRVGRGIGS